ncbi:MAG: acetyl-CoA carboxylase carboxyltransferase subunit alpha [Lachnospiraceae bacterium]|nr:acetyl-CoA carboxylase carboxyltransferase subunit alpha [Lachnospiraceae bacterium]
MKLDQLFKKRKKPYVTIKVSSPEVPNGYARKCKNCGAVVFAEEVKEKGYCCPKCNGYFRMHAMRRIQAVTDEGSFEPWFAGMTTPNPLEIEGYEQKVEKLRAKTGLDEAVTTGSATIAGHKVAIAVCDSRFMMSSMGHIVGEKITKTVERATDEGLPVIMFACSGGARMQEGMISLMQMAKTAAALKRHSDKGNLYISVLTDPTTGGVTASFAMLGDIIIAEPGALIGFAGPRVIEQTIGQKLPEGFQRSEFLLEHGFIDAIVERKNMKRAMIRLLELHSDNNIVSLTSNKAESAVPNKLVPVSTTSDDSLPKTPIPYSSSDDGAANELTAWERVLISRNNDRPVGDDYIKKIFTDFAEFHGDRLFGDDKAIVGGVAKFNGQNVTVIAQCKGHNTKENIKRNFGMPSPEGYRKALRLMRQAEKFNRPIICFVDTPGAFCGLEAEERGQGEAIARNLWEMSSLKVPVLTVVIGEGGSGGALAMAVSNEVWMLQNSVYSILSPEGYASILWKDSSRAKEAATVMKMTAGDLKELGIVEKVLEEPQVYTVDNMQAVVNELRQNISKFLEKMKHMDSDKIVEDRYKRFRKY